MPEISNLSLSLMIAVAFFGGIFFGMLLELYWLDKNGWIRNEDEL